MTIGNTGIDVRNHVPYYLNGSLNGSTYCGRYSYKTWNGADGLTASTLKPGILRVYTTLDRRTGKVVKRYFRERSRRIKHSVPHVYEMSSFRYACEPFNYTNVYYVAGQQFVQNLTDAAISAETALLPTLPIWTANDDLKLINQLKEKARGSDFNLSLFLSQGNQALQMVGDSAIRIARGLRLVKRGNIIGAVHEMSKSARQTEQLRKRLKPKGLWTAQFRRNGTNQVSSNWLELQYGWLPLLQDIKSGAELVADKLNVPHRTRVVARHSVKNAKAGTEHLAWRAADAHAIVYKQIVAYFSEPESIPKLLGVTDPASIAWEVTPFSFVVDWFIPIGDWLEARAYASDLVGTFVQTTMSRRRWNGLSGASWVQPSGSYGTITITKDPSYYCESVTMSRSISTSLSVPKPQFKGLEKAASWQHCVNGLALLAQAATGMKVPGLR